MRHNRIPFLLCLFVCGIPTFLSSCSSGPGGSKAGPIYEEASLLYRHNRYPEALDAFNKALALDTLKGFSRQAVDALLQKSRIEYLTGEYDAAFRTFGTIENHAAGTLPDSVHTALLISRARMHAELGNFGQAAADMGRIRQPDPWQRLEQAALWIRSGDHARASKVCQGLLSSEDPAVRIMALSGLLDCSLARRDPTLDPPDTYAGKIAAVSGKVMSMPAPAEVRIRALRTAARSLQQLEKQRPNASFLLFRALAIAQQARLTRLDQILQFESNEVVVRKPEVYRSVIEYFSQKNMPYARLAALYRLGMTPELKDGERIEVLKNGLHISQDSGFPATAADYVRLEREAVGNLEDLLIANGRYFELFEVSEQAKLLELQRNMQAGIDKFRLPAGHEALQNEIIGLTRDISGLTQRKINRLEAGAGFELSVPADKAIVRKRGRLIELVSEAAAIDKGAASMIRLTPVTLMTVQKSLRSDEALVRLFIRDSLATGMLISAREMQIISSPVSKLEVGARIAALRQTMASGGQVSAARLRADQERIWLTEALMQSMSDRISGYGHLVFVSDIAVPFHLLGGARMLGEERRVSMLGSAKEAVMYPELSPAVGQASGNAFFDASRTDLAGIYKMYHPADRVFLTWKPMLKGDIDRLETRLAPLLKQGGSGSGCIREMASRDGEQTDCTWTYVTSYGID